MKTQGNPNCSANKSSGSTKITEFYDRISLLLGAVLLTILPVQPLSAAEVVGTIPGDFSVSKNGAATYTIPIDTPSATGGMRPRLSLTHAHRGGTGIAGQGWKVGGLPRITRCPKTLAQDNEIRGVEFNAQDRFCLDGQRLVVISGTYGAPGSQYRTEIEGFKKIVANGTQGSGPSSFTIWDRDGTKHSYGSSQQSSLLHSPSNSYRFWARYRTEDRFGNEINYQYSANSSTGEFLLSTVSYTKNTAQSLTERYRAVFTYGTRPDSDKRSGFLFGAIWSNNQRLTKVDVQHFDSVWGSISDYTLSYSTGTAGRSQLDSVKRCTPTDCLPASTFDWQDAVAGWEVASSSGQSSTGHTNPLVGDFNGDGQQDLFVVKNGEWHVLTGSGGDFAASIDTNKSAPNAASTMTLDFNGDGMTDLLVPGSDAKWHVYLSTGTGFTDINTGETTTGYYDSEALDVDGDGLDDLLYQSGSKIYLRKSTGTDLAVTASIVLSEPFLESFIGHSNRTSNKTIDFDGDRRGDILVLTIELEECEQEEEGEEECDDPEELVEWVAYIFDGTAYTKFGTIFEPWSTPVPVDLNGDRLTDLVYYEGNRWNMYISNGVTLNYSPNSPIFDAYSSKAVFADYDGDGRRDLIRATSTNWYVHKSNGSQFETSGIAIGGPAPLTTPLIPMDVAGNGHDELVMSYSNLWQIRDHKSPLVDVVTKFTDGLGNYFEPTYESISSSPHYNQTYFGTPPEDRSFQDPYFVVTDLTANNGIGGTYTNTYYYWGAKMHLRGRGFLGFRQMRTYDPREGTRFFRNLYRQDFPYVGRLEWQEIWLGDWSSKIKKTDPTWISTQTQTGVYFVRPGSITTNTYEITGALKNTSYRTVVNTPIYETVYGNVTQRVVQTTSAQVPGDTYTTTLNFQYTNLTTHWCLGLPTQVTSTRSATGATTKTRTINNTFDGTACHLLTTINASETNAALQLKTTVSYDSYGNIKTVTRDSANGAAADRKAELFYDQWGHLVDSETSYVDSTTDSVISQTWDYRFGLPLTLTSTQGQTTSYLYDSFGRPTNETNPDGTSTTIAYANCVDCWIAGSGRFSITRTESDGFVELDTRDRYGRQIGLQRSLSSGALAKSTTVYDARGRVSTRYAPWVSGETPYSTTYTYDLTSRLTQINAPISESQTTGAISTLAYQGLSQTFTNAESQSSTTDVDPLGRVEKVTDALSGQTKYEYTVFSELHKTWDPANNLITTNYNTRGDIISVVDPNLGSWTFGHNVFGEQTSQTDAKSQSTTTGYNQLGLVTSRIEAEGTTTWNYYSSTDHKLWLPSSVTAPGSFSESYSYDTLSRPSSVTTTIDGTGYVTDISYHSSGSAKGKLKRLTYPTSTSGVRFKADYDYDAWGQLEKVKNGDTPSTVYYQLHETDAFGRERLSTLGNGLDEDRDYDRAASYLKSIRTGANLTATVQNLSYQWNKIGVLQQRQDVNQSKTEVFSYDNLNRVKTATLNSSLTLSVDYDSAGNITYKSDVGTYTYGAGGAGPNAVTSITGTRPGTYAYDNNGNMTTRAGKSITWYSYDKPNRINYGNDYAEFKYGPNRDRYKQVAYTGGATTTTYYVGGHFEKETSGGITSYRHNILANGNAIAIHTRPTSGSVTTRYLHRDHLGSVVAATNESGTVLEQYSFDAFGKRRNADWSADTSDLQFSVSQLTERGYTGHEHLDNVRLIHMNGRVQDPTIGRMISADPFIPYPLDGQSFNRYSYVRNSPLTLVDPSGFYDHDFNEEEDDWLEEFCFANSDFCEDDGGFIGDDDANDHDHDHDNDNGRSVLGSIFSTIIDFTPIIGDIKGIVEAIRDPTPVNIIAAGIGLAGPWGDAAARALKTGARLADAAKRVPKGLVGRSGRDALGETRLRGLNQNRSLADLTDADIRKTFADSPLTLSDHAVSRILDPRTRALGAQTPNDIARLLNKGSISNAGGGDIAIQLGRLEAIVNPATNVVETIRPFRPR